MPAAAALDDALLDLAGIPLVHPRLGRCVRPEPGLDDLGGRVADLPDEGARPVQEPVNLIGLALVRIDAEQRGELGLLGHDARGVHVGLDLLGAVGVFSIAVGEEGWAVRAEARRGARSGHAADDGEGHGGIAGGGGEARDAGEGGLVGLDAVGLHPGEDVEAALGSGAVGVRVGSGGVGAEVEQAVVVVEGERDGGVRGEGVVVEAERGGKVGVAGAHVELVAEEALGGFAGAAAAGGLAFATAGAGVLQRWGRGGGGGVAASASKGDVFDQEAAALARWGEEEAEGGGGGSEGRRRHGGTHGFVGVPDWVWVGTDLRKFNSSSVFYRFFPLPLLLPASTNGWMNRHRTETKSQIR